MGNFHQTVKCLLIYPNPESALNEEAGKLLLEQYQDYFSRAKMMTEIHAQSATARSQQTCSSSSSNGGGSGASGGGGDGGCDSERSVAAGKKRLLEKNDKKKKDKKKALKRL